MSDEVLPTTMPKGKQPKVKHISLTKPDAEGYLTIRVKVNPHPKMSASGKCYLLHLTQGQSDWVENLGGVDRKIRMSLIVYAKIPATERRAALAQEAVEAEQRGEPKLF